MTFRRDHEHAIIWDSKQSKENNNYANIRDLKDCIITGAGETITRDFNFHFNKGNMSVLKLESHTRPYPIFEGYFSYLIKQMH